MKLVYDYPSDTLEECSLNGEEIKDEEIIRIALQDFHFNNFSDFFDLPIEEVTKNAKPRMVVTNDFSIYEELLVASQNLDSPVEGRIIMKK